MLVLRVSNIKDFVEEIKRRDCDKVITIYKRSRVSSLHLKTRLYARAFAYADNVVIEYIDEEVFTAKTYAEDEIKELDKKVIQRANEIKKKLKEMLKDYRVIHGAWLIPEELEKN